LPVPAVDRQIRRARRTQAWKFRMAGEKCARRRDHGGCQSPAISRDLAPFGCEVMETAVRYFSNLRSMRLAQA
jgi:hypothetical protein